MRMATIALFTYKAGLGDMTLALASAAKERPVRRAWWKYMIACVFLGRKMSTE